MNVVMTFSSDRQDIENFLFVAFENYASKRFKFICLNNSLRIAVLYEKCKT